MEKLAWSIASVGSRVSSRASDRQAAGAKRIGSPPLGHSLFDLFVRNHFTGIGGRQTGGDLLTHIDLVPQIIRGCLLGKPVQQLFLPLL